VLTATEAADIKRLAIQANDADAQRGLIARRCDDPAVLARVVAVVRSTPEGVVADAEAS
jgi:hypothetical protein